MRLEDHVYIYSYMLYSCFAHSLTFIFMYLSFLSLSQTVPGCYPALRKLVDDNAVVIIGVALGIAALEVLNTLFLSIILKVRKSHTAYYGS